MKVSKWNLSPLQIIYGLAIINSLALIFIMGWNTSPDSPSYIQAWDTLLSGKIDEWRTPTYPIFLGIIQSITGKQYLHFTAMCIQHLLFLLSIRYFHQIVKQICQGDKVSFWITILYALHPGIASWNNLILTESLAVIFSVFLVYSALKVWKEASLKACFYFTLWLLLLIFLRPAFVYMLPVSLVAWIMAGFKRKEIRSVSFICIVGVITVSCCQLLYMKAFETKYGVFTPSGISTVNQYYIARQNGILNPNLIQDSLLRNYIENSITQNGVCYDNQHEGLWYETNHVINTYGLKNVQDAVSISNKSNLIGWLKKTGGRSYRATSCSLFIAYCGGPIATLIDMVGCCLNFLYLFLIIYTGILIGWIFKKHSLPWISCLFYMLGCSNLIVAIVGAQAEWSRLVLPSLPVYLLMFGQLCNLIRISKAPNGQLE